MAAWLEEPKQGQPITAEWAAAVVRAINELRQDGPHVVAPLAKFEGAIYLAQDYQVYYALTTGAISPRAKLNSTNSLGAQVMTMPWGSGPAKLLTLDASGNEVTMPGAAAVTIWNPFGAPIAAGIRVSIAWSYERWSVLGGDCSGVA